MRNICSGPIGCSPGSVAAGMRATRRSQGPQSSPPRDAYYEDRPLSGQEIVILSPHATTDDRRFTGRFASCQLKFELVNNFFLDSSSI